MIELDPKWEGANLDQLIGKLDDLSPVWDEVGQWFATREQKVFATSGFGRWAALRASTLKLHQSRVSSRPLLRTGSLLATMTTPRPVRATKNYGVFGSHGGEGDEHGMHTRAGRHGPRRNPLPGLTAGERVTVRRLIRKQLFG